MGDPSTSEARPLREEGCFKIDPLTSELFGSLVVPVGDGELHLILDLLHLIARRRLR